MTFAEKLQELRAAKQLTQKGLADASGVRQSSITDWETGKTIPGFDAVQALCKALGVACTVFDGCEHATVESRGRGRPSTKSDHAPPVVKSPTKRKPKGGEK